VAGLRWTGGKYKPREKEAERFERGEGGEQEGGVNMLSRLREVRKREGNKGKGRSGLKEEGGPTVRFPSRANVVDVGGVEG